MSYGDKVALQGNTRPLEMVRENKNDSAGAAGFDAEFICCVFCCPFFVLSKILETIQ